ncbi:MAG: hypothetical protein COA45_09575 [Zetaproteobacteria bacterium]|nr:MAG: hypothetical protein COA45_09575 [Zetaproteobacteria bacterium]
MNTQTSLSTTLHFTPLLEPQYLWAIAFLGSILLLLSVLYYRRGTIIRSLTFMAFMAALLNPSILKEQRNTIKDVAVIVVDQSASQDIGQRKSRTNIALKSLTKQIEDMDMFDLRILHAPANGTLQNRTDLFDLLDQNLADVPQRRRAGVIFLTDGQIHDIPQNEETFNIYGPVHNLLSGNRNEKDRQLIIMHAPAYGLVGKNVTIKYRVEDTKNIGQPYASVTLTLHSGQQRTFNVPVNQEQSIILPLEHPSQNIFALEADGIKGEITLANNKSAIIINGVRDRLKVLLVSGIPHAGERTWRGLLTSDPGVDLIHFTILREPKKFDYTPKNELSLIAFPFKELFEVKLYDFDLIIFDRYRVNQILPRHYFNNIARYVREGGAFLEASGPAFATRRSIDHTALGDILPGKSTGRILEQPFTPHMTDLGHTHPVTKNLIWNNTVTEKGKEPPWGPWLRTVIIDPVRGDILMNSAENQPLLLLDRVEKGRVAQISSDHIWLWSRGYKGGGPHAELLRRIVHWLMKEPELDERSLNITVHNNNITVRKQNYMKTEKETIALTLPNGEHITVNMHDNGQGFLEYKHNGDQLGIYVFEDTHGARKFAIIGELNPPELRGVKTTAKKLQPLVNASRGTTIWLNKSPTPSVNASKNTQHFGGSNWLSLKRNNDHTVTSVKDIPILPEWIILFSLLSVLLLLWRREGKHS